MEKYGLIGEGISHSLSPAIHTVFGNPNYSLYPMKREELKAFFANRDFRGLNVTMPYKEKVIEYLDEIIGVAKELKAVNTIVKTSDNNLVGYNTDYDGFIYSIDKNEVSLTDKNILILGSGGAAKMVKAVCRERGAKNINTVSRTGDIDYNNAYDLTETEIIINATPVGMYPNNGRKPIDLSRFPKCTFVFDLIYNPLKTALLIQAEDLNIPNTNGLDMLAAQARKGAELFTGKSITKEMIESAVKTVKRQTANVVLIGMPGCGKTTVASLLANKLGKEFFDTDAYIHQFYGSSPADIITLKGEEVFRAFESKTAIKAGQKMNTVIATGGGIVLNPDNMKHLTQNSMSVIYIDRNLKLLENKERPLSKDITAIKALHKRRLPLYKKHASITIDGDGTPEEVANSIISALS